MTRLVLLGTIVVLAGCGGGESEEPVSIQFAAKVGDEEFACGQSYSGVGSSGTEFTANDLRLYIHQVRLVAADGEEHTIALDQETRWQRDDVVLLDFEDGSATCENGTPGTNATVVGTAPDVEYTGIELTFGVPFELNHANAATADAPLNLTSMFWSWNGGYKFLRVDGDTPGLEGWRLHVGSTACEGDDMGNVSGCDNPNRATIALGDFDPESNTVVVDVAGLMEGADLEGNTMDTPPGCMSGLTDPDCRPYFHNLGLPWQDTESPGQKLFRVE